jgi:hypothetical protein
MQLLSMEETIQHLFSDCYYIKFLWGLTHTAFGITPPQSIQHMFRSWTNKVGGKLKRRLLAAASAFCWAIWLSRNDIILYKASIKNFLACTIQGIVLASLLILAEKA